MASQSNIRGSPLDHVVDNTFLEFPWGNFPLPVLHFGLFDVQVTRFMVMEAGGGRADSIAGIIIPLARHVAKHPVTRGPFLNAFEAMVLFIRDDVARPAIGGPWRRRVIYLSSGRSSSSSCSITCWA